MTTHVPAGTPDAAVDEVRAREAVHTRERAAQGHVLRLWRPPLAPGEWRTLGLFAAASRAELEQVLSSMPLRVWRSDEVQDLAPHPNDPPPGTTEAAGTGLEFLVTFTPVAPAAAEVAAQEADAARVLAHQGQLIRLWSLASGSTGPALGLWRAVSEAQLQTALAALPLRRYITTQTTKLTPHPSDPAAPGSRPRILGQGYRTS